MTIDLTISPILATDRKFLTALALNNLPTADLATSRGHYFSAVINGQLVGYGGYESLGRAVLLRSVVVVAVRKVGVGRAIAEAVLEHARGEGGEVAFLLTENAAGFFAALGFDQITREQTPAVIKSHPQYDRLCAETAVIMQKRFV
ncbi:hypothetical protein MNBD_ALPHA09-2172 [hydrothermal vent metagenome]|uniref:N-acetyltransferase domain-containing protein n=1 Tax=hydrothermal vent metagenome TaxID=652676 RepID=A0A3B0T2P1_9ZZZZ